MIRREDFIKAIGQPDAGFTEAVDSALAVIRAREERKKPRRYHMILPVAAAAVIFFVFMGAALRGGFAPKQPGSGVLAQPETAAQKMTQAPVTFTPSPAPAETPQPTLEAEMAYATLPPDNEVYPTAAPYEAEDVPEPEEIPYNEAAHYDWPELTLDDAEMTVTQYLFDGNVAALYPGFELTEITRENMPGRECIARWIANGTYEMAVKWIEIAAPQHLPEYIADSYNGRKFYAVTLDVPASWERIGLMMDTGYDWQKTIYEASLMRMEDAFGAAVRTDDYYMLTGMTVYLDENGIINYIELFFGDEFKGYLLWRYESYDSGDFGYELLLDEYGAYGFDDIFGDPTVSVTAEPTREPETVSEVTKAIIDKNVAGMDFFPIETTEKYFLAYEQLLDALYPEHMDFQLGYEVVVMDGVAMDSVAMLRRNDESDVHACWLTMDSIEGQEELCYVLNIAVPEEIGEDYDVLIKPCEWLAEMHCWSCQSIRDALGVDRLPEGYGLNGIKLYLDDGANTQRCELYYGGDLVYSYEWKNEGYLGDAVEMDCKNGYFDYYFEETADVEYSVNDTGLSDLVIRIGELLNLDRVVGLGNIGQALGTSGLGIIGGADGPTQVIVGNAGEEYDNSSEALENAALGIIGGADGPTQVIVSSMGREETAVEPDEYDLFRKGFGVELTAFYPGYTLAGQTAGLVSARGLDFDCDYWLLSDGQGEISAAWLTRGEITQSDRESGTTKFPTLSVIMPEDPELIDAVMLNTHAGLADTYYKCRDYACEMLGDPSAMYKGWELAGIKVTFDVNDEPFVYEFYFGSDRKIYFMFVRESDGDFSMQKQYFDEDGTYFSEYFGVPVKGLPTSDIRMFEFAFGQPVDILYPGNDGIYVEGDSKYTIVKVKYGAASVDAWSLSRGKLWDTSEYADGSDFISVNAYIPGDAPECVEAFMDGCPDWLYEIYTSDLNSGMYKPLRHVIVTYTPEGDLYACEMIFDDGENTYYERWMLNESGVFEIYESGGGVPVE